jgi:hypothetical protein
VGLNIRDLKIEMLEAALARARADADRLRRQNESLAEVVDARGDHLTVVERRAAFWQEEAMRRGEMLDRQTQRLVRVQFEREGLARQLDLEYIRINQDLEVEAAGGEEVGGGGNEEEDAEVGPVGDGDEAGAVALEAVGGGGYVPGQEVLFMEPGPDDTGYITCAEY